MQPTWVKRPVKVNVIKAIMQKSNMNLSILQFNCLYE